MGKSVMGKLKNLIFPRVVHDLPPYIPRSFPQPVEENTEHEELKVEGDEKSPRDKIQTDTQTKTNY
jgi:hypothetical protein